jgi:hypothetical protein
MLGTRSLGMRRRGLDLCSLDGSNGRDVYAGSPAGSGRLSPTGARHQARCIVKTGDPDGLHAGDQSSLGQVHGRHGDPPVAG